MGPTCCCRARTIFDSLAQEHWRRVLGYIVAARPEWAAHEREDDLVHVIREPCFDAGELAHAHALADAVAAVAARSRRGKCSLFGVGGDGVADADADAGLALEMAWELRKARVRQESRKAKRHPHCLHHSSLWPAHLDRSRRSGGQTERSDLDAATRAAARLSSTRSHFRNPHGWDKIRTCPVVSIASVGQPVHIPRRQDHSMRAKKSA